MSRRIHGGETRDPGIGSPFRARHSSDLPLRWPRPSESQKKKRKQSGRSSGPKLVGRQAGSGKVMRYAAWEF